MLKNTVTERSLIIYIMFTLVFFTLMFSQEFGQVYIAMSLTWLVLLLFDRHGTTYPIERNNKNRLASVLLAIVFVAGMLLVSAVVTSVFYPGALPEGGGLAGMEGVLKIISQKMAQSSGPILKDSMVLMFIGWAIIIPIIETHLINGRMFEAITDNLRSRGLKVDSLASITLLMVFLLTGAIAAILHLSSKAFSAPELMVTFVFFGLSSVLVFVKKHTREAIISHSLVNALAVATLAGWL